MMVMKKLLKKAKYSHFLYKTNITISDQFHTDRTLRASCIKRLSPMIMGKLVVYS